MAATKIKDISNRILSEYDDLLQPVPPELPPFREVNHTIPLIDEKMRYTYRLPKCPEALKGKLLEKIERYTKAGWWVPAQVDQAAPLMCILKKDGGLRTVVDLRLRNDNTVKDVTPFPDQDQIRHDVARAKYRSKFDMSDAYEQTRIEDSDVWKTAFSTVYGTFLSRVTQQGDCNAPSTFQRLMVRIFREKIGIFVHVYLDDIFVFSDTIEEHEQHVRWCLDRLRDNRLYLSRKKCDIFSRNMDCLGHLIDDRGLHADMDKMARVRDWPTPRNYNDVQRFLGLVQYLAHFMPDVSSYMGPLSSMTRNGQVFNWRPLHQKCLESIRMMACKTPILRPIDPRKGETIWVITDASTTGVGAVYGQGPEWQTCRPAGFMSKKFTSAQTNYFTFEVEALAIIEALMKWEDKLIGIPFTIVTDHKALSFLRDKKKLSPRLERWLEYLSRFNYTILYVKGETNKVADSLSRYYASEPPDTLHPPYDMVTADIRLDPDGEYLPERRIAELRMTRVVADSVEPRRLESEELNRHLHSSIDVHTSQTTDDDPSLSDSMMHGPSLRVHVEGQFDLRKILRNGYKNDSVAQKVLQNPTHHERFRVNQDLVEHLDNRGNWVLLVPQVMHGRKRLAQVLLDQAHSLVGHLGYSKTNEYVRRWFWWPNISRDVEKYCVSCPTCQTIKTSTQRPQGLLHNLPIPSRPWQSISMDFVGPFPDCDGLDYLWVIVCRMTGMTHLVPTRTTVRASELAWMFLKEVVRLHGLPESIVSDRDPKFTSKFWRELHRLMGIKLLMSTAFHPQTDGTSERMVRTVSQILRAMVQPDQRDWARRIPMTEFAINSSINASTGFAPFELVSGYMPTLIRDLAREPALPGVRDFAERAIANVQSAHDTIIASRVSQTHYANRHRREENTTDDPDFKVGGLAYLSTTNLSLPKGRARKLLPKFIGPYRIIAANPRTSTYTLELPPDLRARGIHPTFHVERLRRHEPNDTTLFPGREATVFYDFGQDPDQEFLVDSIVAHQWEGGAVRFLVQWDDGDLTWETWATVKDLEAVDQYFELQGVSDWRQLPKNGAQKSERDKRVATQQSPKVAKDKHQESSVPAAAGDGPTRTVTDHPNAISRRDPVTVGHPVTVSTQSRSRTATEERGRGHRVRRPHWKLVEGAR